VIRYNLKIGEINMDKLKKLNNQIGNALIGVQCVAIMAYFIALGLKVNSAMQTGILLCVSILCILTILFAKKKYIDTYMFRYIMVGQSILLYISMAILVPINTAFIFGMSFMGIFVLYSDYKVIIASLTGYIVSTIVNIVYWVFVVGHMPSGNSIDKVQYIVQVCGTLLYSSVLGISSYIAQKSSEANIADLKDANEKTNGLINNMIKVANKVKEKATVGVEHIGDLDKSAENSNVIFEKISEGNTSNASSVEEQTEMTMKITELLNTMLNDTKQAKNKTGVSIKSLNVSKNSLVDLKNKSDEIIVKNNKLLSSIEKFVDNTRNVKKITEGISDISEQTNLLSLNASIESARAGEAGRGFAIVAEEIRKLSDETASLTTDIAQIVAMLENDANEAQSIIGEVEASVVEETKTIDETLNVFHTMENDISSLGIDMDNILGSSENVVNYNNSIMEHIEKLSGETEEVTAYIEEALSLNRLNRQKTETTKDVIEQLSSEVEQLL
jgi:methyl-accepting chemotaxis protein